MLTSLALPRSPPSSPVNKLDPPSAQLLFLKSASVCFACSHAWVLSGGQQGRVLHMMRMIADLVCFMRGPQFVKGPHARLLLSPSLSHTLSPTLSATLPPSYV